MKKRLAILVILCLCISTTVFYFKWQEAKNDHSELLELAQWSAEESYDYFLSFQKSVDERNYWDAVANFRAYLQAYMQYCSKTDGEWSDYAYATDVYFSLINFPELCREHIPELIEITELLSKNACDPNAHLRMHNLRNDITE